jgi:hypothetical protein
MLKTVRPVSEADLLVEMRNKSTDTRKRPCHFLHRCLCAPMTKFEGSVGQDLREMLSGKDVSSMALLSIA